MIKSLIDTDILSEIFKGYDSHVSSRAAEYLRLYSGFTISVISVAEMVRGYRRISSEKKLNTVRDFLSEHEIIPIGSAEAELAGVLLADLEKAGTPIGHLDPFIAATALTIGIPLVTGNTKHFIRIKELGYPLELQNWRA